MEQSPRPDASFCPISNAWFSKHGLHAIKNKKRAANQAKFETSAPWRFGHEQAKTLRTGRRQGKDHDIMGRPRRRGGQVPGENGENGVANNHDVILASIDSQCFFSRTPLKH